MNEIGRKRLLERTLRKYKGMAFFSFIKVPEYRREAFLANSFAEQTETNTKGHEKGKSA
jgi:hypothetical protein